MRVTHLLSQVPVGTILAKGEPARAEGVIEQPNRGVAVSASFELNASRLIPPVRNVETICRCNCEAE